MDLEYSKIFVIINRVFFSMDDLRNSLVYIVLTRKNSRLSRSGVRPGKDFVVISIPVGLIRGLLP